MAVPPVLADLVSAPNAPNRSGRGGRDRRSKFYEPPDNLCHLDNHPDLLRLPVAALRQRWQGLRSDPRRDRPDPARARRLRLSRSDWLTASLGVCFEHGLPQGLSCRGG